jgi:8-oxo-dGTP pyrophosphatase MutT (NUDIX family)
MKATVPVFLFLVDSQDRVYLQRRFRTGYLDGYYEPPAGKTDHGELLTQAACREAREEAGVIVDPASLELFHTYLNLSNNNPWLGIMFRTRTWQGTPAIQEPDKCDDAGFFALNTLPSHLTPQVRDGLSHLLSAPSIAMDNYSDIQVES